MVIELCKKYYLSAAVMIPTLSQNEKQWIRKVICPAVPEVMLILFSQCSGSTKGLSVPFVTFTIKSSPATHSSKYLEISCLFSNDQCRVVTASVLSV